MQTRSRLRELRRNTDKYLMLLPFTVLFLLFTVIPVLSSIALSFTD